MKPVEYRHVAPTSLSAHSRNATIYGEQEDVGELVELISRSGWVKPLVITNSGTIISGHRRWKAALELGLATIPVEVREFADSTAELEALLLENATRIKTTEQKVREALAWKEIETQKAKRRMIATQNNQAGKAAMENFPQLLEKKGTTRDALARRVGLGSGRTYAKATKVVDAIDSLLSRGEEELARKITEVLNTQSVDAAYRSVRNADSTTSDNCDFLHQETNSNEINKFAIGDYVEVNQRADSFKGYIGMRGRVERVLAVEQQVSVNLENGDSKIRFYPHELDLIAKAPPPCPFKLGDIVFVDIDRKAVASPQERKWDGFWGKVQEIGELGSIRVNLGRDRLQLLPHDLKPIDVPTTELQDVVERVLQLRGFELDEIERKMLDFLQRREWFTPCQLHYLELMERFHFDSCDCCCRRIPDQQ